ncbi:unnamed protein product, partial [Prorocentrum cordatum]
MIHDAVRQPLIIAGDFNVSTNKLIESNYPLRAGLKILAPNTPTCKMKKSASTIDFVLASSCFDQDLSGATVLDDYPLSPHRPVLFQLRCGQPFMVPVLEKPQPFSTTRPYGPSKFAPSWDRTSAALDFLDQVIAQESDIEARVLALSSAYQYFANDMARSISIRTDAPIKSPTMPRVGRAPPGALAELDVGGEVVVQAHGSWHWPPRDQQHQRPLDRQEPRRDFQLAKPFWPTGGGAELGQLAACADFGPARPRRAASHAAMSRWGMGQAGQRPPAGGLRPGAPLAAGRVKGNPAGAGVLAGGAVKRVPAAQPVPAPRIDAAFTVSTQSKKDEIGIQTLVGDYAEKGTNHGRKYYKKVQKIAGHEDVNVFLYYWDERDGADFSGWWFGDALGGSQVWGRAASSAPTPPRAGWKVPWDSPKVEPGILTVEPFKAVPVRPEGGPALLGLQYGTGTPGSVGGPKFDPVAYQDKVMEAKMKVDEFEVTATDILAVAQTALVEGAAPESLADIKGSLEKHQGTLMELQKHLTSEISEMRKGGAQATSFVTEISKLSPRLMKLRPGILTELGKISKVAGNVEAAKKVAETAAAQKAAEEKDAKELSEILPVAQELVTAAEDATESLSILASPLVADPPDEAGDALKDAMTEIEAATADAQAKIAEARKEINLKLQAARRFAPETRKSALLEFSNLQQKLTEAQKKLNPYKNFRTSFRERVEAKKALQDLTDKIGAAELEVEKASMMCQAGSQGQMSEDEITAAEKVVKPQQTNLMAILKTLEQKVKAAQEGPLREELAQMRDRAAGIKKKLDGSSSVLKTQLEGVAVQQTIKTAGEKVQSVEEALEKTQEAELPFLKGIEVLPQEESNKAIGESEAAATRAGTAAAQAMSFIKQKLAAAKSYSKETQKSFTEEMDVLQKRLEESTKKIDAFKKETLERKMAAFMSEVSEGVQAAEEKVKALQEASEVLSKDDLDGVSTEALKEALEKTKAAEKEAQAACAEARKTMGAKTAAAKAKGGEMLAAVGKVQGRLNTAQQDLAKARRACLNGEKLVKTKEVITAQEAKIKETEEEVDKLEATSNPAESGLGDEKLSDDTISKIDTGVKDAQKSLKESARLVEAQIPGASASLKPALEQLRDRSKKCQDVISKILAATKDQRERVVSEGYVREATAKTEELEKGMDKVNAAELPFLKGLEVLPLQEAQDTIKNSNSIAADVQKQVTDARSYIAAKSLEVKKFTETVSQPAVEEFTKLTERINGTASKLSQFRKDTGHTSADASPHPPPCRPHRVHSSICLPASMAAGHPQAAAPAPGSPCRLLAPATFTGRPRIGWLWHAP